MAPCLGCGAPVAPGDRFCQACGLPKWEAAVPSPAGRCSGCGMSLEAGDRFCVECGTPVPRTGQFAPPVPAPADVPGYAILEVIGRGGFATVYRARQLSFDREVALKILSPTALGPALARRFRGECQTIGGLSWHPHVVPVYDAGFSPLQEPYLAMELFSDGSFGERVRRSGPLRPVDVVRIGAQVADALATAHAAGVLHRDVKPDNLLIGRRGEVRLGDFGVATINDASMSASGSFLGTLAYSAPELIRGERASSRSDVFAVGSTLFTLLTGRTAFSSESDESPAALIWRLLNEPIPTLPRDVPAPLRTVVTRAMSKDPEARQASAQHLMDELKAG